VSDEMVALGITAEAKVRAADPHRLLVAMIGAGGGDEAVQGFVDTAAGAVIDAAVVRLLDEKCCSILELVQPDGAAEVRARALRTPPDLRELGLELTGFGAFVMTLADEDVARVREALAQVATMQGAMATTQTDSSLLDEALGATRTETAPTGKMSQLPSTLAVGTVVQALYSDGRYYPARVLQLSRGHYEVGWESGGGTSWVAPHQLMPLEASDPAVLAAGSHVLVQWTDGKVYGGTVRQRQRGHYEIAWDAGGAGWVPEQNVRPG
jgi:hypothetical protein